MRNADFAGAWSDKAGTSTVEFGMVAPAFILVLVGAISLCLALFFVGSLHFAVEQGARCASVNTTLCGDAASIVSYTQSQYYGPAASPTFTYTAASCGNSVSATANYAVNLGITKVMVPVSASACFP